MWKAPAGYCRARNGNTASPYGGCARAHAYGHPSRAGSAPEFPQPGGSPDFAAGGGSGHAAQFSAIPQLGGGRFLRSVLLPAADGQRAYRECRCETRVDHGTADVRALRHSVRGAGDSDGDVGPAQSSAARPSERDGSGSGYGRAVHAFSGERVGHGGDVGFPDGIALHVYYLPEHGGRSPGREARGPELNRRRALYRSATSGEIRVARRAGTNAANSATASSPPATAANVTGSVALVPKSRVESTRVK